MPAPVALSRWRGSASAFHARPVDGVTAPEVWAFDVDAPALVLGSSQSWEAADAAACAAAGVQVVRRRSGGGAVLLVPAAVVWFDVVVPGAVLQRAGVGDDVAGSMIWLGRRVEEALRSVGATATRVHDGPMRRTAWSAAVCFDGLGPGELTTADGKLIGISQRRTRAASRFQCAVHVAWAPDALVGLLSPPRPTVAELAPVATLPAALAQQLPAAVAAVLA